MKPLTRSQSLLLLATALSAGLVVLHEAGSLHPLVTPLVAQDEARPLVLSKGAEVVTIPVGDWVVAMDATGQKVFASGRLMQWDGLQLTLQPQKGPTRKISLDMVMSLYHGEAKRILYYTGKGAKYGAGVGLVGGLALSVGLVAECGLPTGPTTSLLVNLVFLDVIMSGFASIYTVPAGVVLGFLGGLVKSGQAKKYIIGPGEWEIVAQ